MSTIAIRVEPCSHLIETELWPLLVKHREELTTNKDLMELAPIAAQYREAESAGVLFAVTVRKDGHLIGYSVNFVGPHLHYSGMRYAHNDVLFLDPAHRKGTVGFRLIQASEDAARERGAKMIVWHAKPGTAMERLLPRLGYRVQDVLFSKEL